MSIRLHNALFRTANCPSIKPRQRTGLAVCQVTNTGEEYGRAPEKILNRPLLERDGRPLYQQVTRDVFDAMASDEVSVADMDFWFSEQEVALDTFLEPAEQIETTDFTLKNYGLGKKPLSELQEGAVMTGVVTGLHFLHGAVVDLGYEWDGLVPINEPQWQNPVVLATMELEMEVTVKIYKIRDPDVFRFPVQLELLSPDLAEHLILPHQWRAPIEIREDSDIEKVIALGYPEYVPTTFDVQNPAEVPNLDEYEDFAFEELYGPTAERPKIRGETQEGEIMLDYDTWQATQVAAKYF